MTLHSRLRFHHVVGGALAALALVQLANLAFVGDASVRASASDLLQLVVSFVSAAATTAAVRVLFRIGHRAARAWVWLAAAAWLWAFGNLAFAYAEPLLGTSGSPAPADFFFVPFYPVAIVGLRLLPAQPVRDKGERVNYLLDVVAMSAVALLAIWQFNLRLILPGLMAAPSLEAFLLLAYTIMDAVLLVVVFGMLVGRLGQGGDPSALILLVLGVFGLVTSDVVEGYVDASGVFASGTFTDMGWVLFNCFSGFAAVRVVSLLQAPAPSGGSTNASGTSRTFAVLAPSYLWIAIVVALLTYAVYTRGAYDPVFLLACVAVLMLVAVTRQIRTVRGHARLLGQLRESASVLEAKVQERTAELSAQQVRLRESEQMFRGIVETTQDWLWAASPSQEFTYSNPAIERILGYPPDEFLAHGIDLLHPDDRVRLERTLDEQRGREVGWTGFVARWRHRDGTYRTLESNAIALHDHTGAFAGFQGADHDVTEKQRLEKQYLRAQRLESVGTLASGVAHDLNNIFSPIIMGVEMLEETAGDDDSRAVLRMMAESARRGAETVRQLLTFARGGDSQKGPVKPRQLLGEVARLLQQTFPKNIQICTDTSAPVEPVLADASQLHQVLMNLCVNARDAMPDGGTLSISLATRQLDDAGTACHPKARARAYVVFTVTDSGAGIPSDVLDRIFDPFFTTKPAGQGTGLGLATVLGIVENHGGFVLVDSRPGQGTTFEVFLPAGSPTATTASNKAAFAAPQGTGELVLIVDDEQSVLRIAQSVLLRGGYEVVTAANTSEALRLFEEQHDQVKAVVTDIMMPIGDGRQFISALAERAPSLPVIAISGAATAEFRAETLRRGAFAFLSKPFTSEQLLTAIAQGIASAASKS